MDDELDELVTLKDLLTSVLEVFESVAVILYVKVPADKVPNLIFASRLAIL